MQFIHHPVRRKGSKFILLLAMVFGLIHIHIRVMTSTTSNERKSATNYFTGKRETMSFDGAWIRHTMGSSSSSSELSRRNEWESEGLRGFETNHTIRVSHRNLLTLNPKRSNDRLEFIHITKTGGSAIEAAAATAGILWGACHYIESPLLHCHHPDKLESSSSSSSSSSSASGHWIDVPLHGEWVRANHEPWHVPLPFHVHPPYPDADTFVVVRDPYDRYISEYYSKWGGYQGSDSHRADNLNAFLQRNVPQRSRQKRVHFLPQHEYVYHNGEQIVDHILHYETLDHEFSALMNYYNLDVHLARKVNVGEAEIRLQRQHLSPETIQLINEVADLDFKLLGYQKIEV